MLGGWRKVSDWVIKSVRFRWKNDNALHWCSQICNLWPLIHWRIPFFMFRNIEVGAPCQYLAQLLHSSRTSFAHVKWVWILSFDSNENKYRCTFNWRTGQNLFFYIFVICIKMWLLFFMNRFNVFFLINFFRKACITFLHLFGLFPLN